MARAGVRERRSRRRQSYLREASEAADDCFDGDDSEGNSLSSSFDDVDIHPRVRALDDALFGFLMKQSVKSLKRNFTDFCKDVVVSPSNQDKRCRRVGVDKSVFTKFSLKYFVEIIKKLTKRQRSVIENFGFGCLLMLDLYDIPSEFARWVAKCIDPVCSQITVQNKTIDISKRTFHVILGLPFGGFDIQSNSNEGEEFILGHFQLSYLPHITFFGNKLGDTAELSDTNVFICFMAVALHCFLCPCSEDHVSGKYLYVLKHPEVAKQHDFSKLVYEHCLSGINHFLMAGKLKGRRPRAPLCCNYVTTVRYLDCLDFGRQNVGVSVPRISVWRGHMIRVFSELDRKKRNHFGKRQLRDGYAIDRVSDSKVKNIKSPVFQSFSPGFRKNVISSFGSNIRPDIIEGIIKIAENGVSNISASNKPKFQLLVTNMLDFLRKSSVRPKDVPVVCGEPVVNNTLGKCEPALLNTQKSCNPVNAPHDGQAVVQQPSCVAKPALASAVKTESKPLTDPVTPDCVITMVVPANSLMTAPSRKPMVKVNKRCNVLPVTDEETFISTGPSKFTKGAAGNRIDISPISRFNLHESPADQPHTVDFKIKRSFPAKGPGSEEAPIIVPETSPKLNHMLVGSNDFRRRSSQMSKLADSIYNNKFMDQAGVDEFIDPPVYNGDVKQPLDVQVLAILNGKHKHMFLNYVMRGQSPSLQQNIRFPVSEEDLINYSAIIELGHHASHMKSMGVLYPEVHCNFQSLGESLMPGGEVDNFFFTCFCRLLFKEKHPSVSGRHYFFPIIGEAIMKYQVFPNDGLIRQTFEGAAKASKGRNLGSAGNRLFFPIVECHHWFVFVVDFEKKLFAFLDSLNHKDSDFHLRKKNLLIDNFILLFGMFGTGDVDFSEFRYMYPNVPKQDNLLDCGVFSMKFMEWWKPSLDLRQLFSYHDVLNIRVQYCLRVFFHSHNESDKSVVTQFYSQDC